MIIEKWKQSHAYVVGKDHLKMDMVCQDRTYYASSNGVHVLALADGAGSRKRSELGAEIVTRKICELLVKDFYKYYMKCEKRGKKDEEYFENMKQLKKLILNELLKELRASATNENIATDELSSTLLFCAIHQDKYIMGHIGDGVIGGLFETDGNLTMKTLSEPRNGGAPNITFFVTDPDALHHLRITSGEFQNLRGIVLMSDGPAEVMYHKSTGLDDNVIRIFENFTKKTTLEYHQILSQFLSDKISTYSSDDLSLNVLYLEHINTTNVDDYITNLLGNITSKDQIIYKSKYCVELDPTLKLSKRDFSSIDDVRRYLKWT